MVWSPTYTRCRYIIPILDIISRINISTENKGDVLDRHYQHGILRNQPGRCFAVFCYRSMELPEEQKGAGIGSFLQPRGARRGYFKTPENHLASSEILSSFLLQRMAHD